MSHVVNPFFADVSRAFRSCASVQTPRKSGLARRCPRTSSRTLRRLATPRSPDNSAPRQRGIVRYNKFTIDPSAIQGFCVNPLYLFRERVKKSGFFRREPNIFPKIWPKRLVGIVVWVEGEIRGYERGGQENGKQCKAVPTLRKQADSVYTEPACFMLVGALPQSPQNTKTVFWNDG